MRRFWLILLFVYSLASALEIKVAQNAQDASSREVFWTDIITFVLDHSKVPYTLSVEHEMTQARIIHELKLNTGRVNLHVMGTSKELEEDLLPIRVPISRGLAGYRLFIIHKDKQQLFDSTTSIKALQALLGLQGIGWTDVEILQYSGLKQKQVDYQKIFYLLDMGRADYFSRSLHEVYAEVAQHKKQCKNLVVEQEVLLVYPFALFAFTNRENKELAKILEGAFEKAYKDGVFTSFFYSHPHIKEALEKAQIDNRVIVKIPNPLMTNETKAIPQRYWHYE